VITAADEDAICDASGDPMSEGCAVFTCPNHVDGPTRRPAASGRVSLLVDDGHLRALFDDVFAGFVLDGGADTHLAHW
jgi:hypothetical protein